MTAMCGPEELSTFRPAHSEGWVLLPPDQVPDVWRTRAREMSLVALLPEESRGLLAGERPLVPVDPDEEQLLRLVTRGASANSIARELGITPRTVQRRLARLRERFEVGSTAELAVVLARRGL